jgi:hypothetical protein
MRRELVRCCALLALLCVMLAGCAGSKPKAVGKLTTHPTATTIPTATPGAPTPTDIVAPTFPPQTTACSTALFSNQSLGYAQQGDIIVGALDFQAPSYPGYQLPANLPFAPYKVDTSFGGKGGAGPAGLPLSNPSTGFGLFLCNASATQTHTITSVTLKVAAFTPYSGTLNEVRACAMVYSRPGGTSGGGCGGGAAWDMQLTGAFPASAPVGTEITMQNSVSSNTSLPATLQPNQTFYIVLSPTLPQLSGTYSYQAGLGIDGAPATYISGGTTPALYAPVTHSWDGGNCLSAAMQAQIPPATNPPTAYICPA